MEVNISKALDWMLGNEDKTDVDSVLSSSRAEKADSQVVIKNVKCDEW